MMCSELNLTVIPGYTCANQEAQWLQQLSGSAFSTCSRVGDTSSLVGSAARFLLALLKSSLCLRSCHRRCDSEQEKELGVLLLDTFIAHSSFSFSAAALFPQNRFIFKGFFLTTFIQLCPNNSQDTLLILNVFNAAR